MPNITHDGMKKTENSGIDGPKLTGMVYRILDFLPDNDPLKNRAKEKALSILEALPFVMQGGQAENLQPILAVIDNLRVMEDYLKIIKMQGWVDGVNFLILTSEYEKIKNLVEAAKRSIMDSRGYQKGRIMAIGKEVLGEDRLRTAVAKEDASVRLAAFRDDAEKIVRNRQEKMEGLKDYSKRQTKILEILSVKQKAQVADIIKELPNVTKRTIRRDLNDLLKKGSVVRVGQWNQVFYKVP